METRALLEALLNVAGNQLVLKLKEGVAAGNLPFGAAVFTKADLEPVTVSVNKVTEWPLLHGETNCLREFWQIKPAESRPAAKDCVFFATHEPCPLCLSGITWTGFNTLIYLFTYEDTRDRFGINDDIDVLESIFRVPAPGDTAETLSARALYNKENKYFSSRSVAELVESLDTEADREEFRQKLEEVRKRYDVFCPQS